MKKTAHYRVGQTLPPRHCYQKSVGWFGKLLVGIFVISLSGAGVYGYILTQASVKSLSAEVANPSRLKKVSESIEPGNAENIIDVQFVLDAWAKKHPGETWSVAVQSIDGPQFSAHINQDIAYMSGSLQKLLTVMPLYEQVPAEHQKNIQLQVGGRTLSMRGCVDVMVRLSDQACSDAVAQYLDFAKASAELKKLGLNNTQYDGTQKVRTTAHDVMKYILALQSNTLPRPAQDTVMQLLREQAFRSGIPAACPGCQVANKSADNDSVVHDAALVRYNGGSYALTIMTRDGQSADISQLAGAIQQKILDTLTK